MFLCFKICLLFFWILDNVKRRMNDLCIFYNFIQFPMGPGPDGPMGGMGAMEQHHMNGSLGE